MDDIFQILRKYILKSIYYSGHEYFSVFFLGDQPGADFGPVISKEAKARIESLVQAGIDEGAQVRPSHVISVTKKYQEFFCPSPNFKTMGLKVFLKYLK